jgi:hypothetical protein
MKINFIFLKTLTLLIALVLVSLSSCNKDCNSPSTVNINNRCDFSVALEVDIVGDSTYTSVLLSGESVTYHPGETRINVKAGKNFSLSLSRKEKFDAKNCKIHTLNLLQNDSATLYRLDIDYSRTW